MLYVDSSAPVKRYVMEPDSPRAVDLIDSDSDRVTAAHAEIEVRRAIAMRLTAEDAPDARGRFLQDWESVGVIPLDTTTCSTAAEISEVTRVRTLDALHLAAASRVRSRGLRFLTFDVRLAAAARALGFAVVGA